MFIRFVKHKAIGISWRVPWIVLAMDHLALRAFYYMLLPVVSYCDRSDSKITGVCQHLASAGVIHFTPCCCILGMIMVVRVLQEQPAYQFASRRQWLIDNFHSFPFIFNKIFLYFLNISLHMSVVSFQFQFTLQFVPVIVLLLISSFLFISGNPCSTFFSYCCFPRSFYHSWSPVLFFSATVFPFYSIFYSLFHGLVSCFGLRCFCFFRPACFLFPFHTSLSSILPSSALVLKYSVLLCF